MTVNGAVASVGDRIDPTSDSVALDGTVIPLNPDLATWLVYKPVGVVTTMDDPQGRPIVSDLVPAEPVTKPVGRLDVHSEGLLLMTNDGDLALRVTHPRYGIEKTYQARTTVRATSKHLQAIMDGVDLEDGQAKATRARIVSSHGGRSIIELTLTEGRKREVRRMLDAVGLPVEQLVRVSIAGISDRSLSPGSYRALTVEEIRSIYRQAEGVA